MLSFMVPRERDGVDFSQGIPITKSPVSSTSSFLIKYDRYVSRRMAHERGHPTLNSTKIDDEKIFDWIFEFFEKLLVSKE